MAFEIRFEGLFAWLEDPAGPSVRALLLGAPQHEREPQREREHEHEGEPQRERAPQPHVHEHQYEALQARIPQHRPYLAIDAATNVTVTERSAARGPEFDLAGYDIEVRCCDDAPFRCDLTSVLHMRELARDRAGVGILDRYCKLTDTSSGRVAATVTLACGSVKATPGDAAHGCGWSIRRISPDFGEISDLSESVVCSIDSQRIQIHKLNDDGPLFDLTSTPGQTAVLYVRNTEVVRTEWSRVDYHFDLYYDLAEQPVPRALTPSGALRSVPTFKVPSMDFVINGVTFHGNPSGGRPICPMALFEPTNF